jgi:hypothetical protein
MSGHTPGPWRIAWSSENGAYHIEGDGFAICRRGPWPNNAAESHANARLIAAAPDLLGVVRELLTLIDTNPSAEPCELLEIWRTVEWGETAARAAISRATGDQT